jgi:recombinational DNA repair protein (RecF pathway)
MSCHGWAGAISSICSSLKHWIVLLSCRVPVFFVGFISMNCCIVLLPQHESEQVLLRAYSLALQQLVDFSNAEPVLREFELTLLDVLGYGLDLQKDASGVPLESGCGYWFVPESGLSRSKPDRIMEKTIFAKAELFMAIAQRDFSSTEVRQLAKSVLRMRRYLFIWATGHCVVENSFADETGFFNLVLQGRQWLQSWQAGLSSG